MSCCYSLVYILMLMLCPVAYPLAKLLDCLLGKNHASFFRRSELKALVGLHGPGGLESSTIPDHGHPPALSYDEVLIIKVMQPFFSLLSTVQRF